MCPFHLSTHAGCHVDFCEVEEARWGVQANALPAHKAGAHAHVNLFLLSHVCAKLNLQQYSQVSQC